MSRKITLDVVGRPPGQSVTSPGTPQRAFSGQVGSVARWLTEQAWWWSAHYTEAVDQIQEFLESDGLPLDNKRVVDLGCGDGILSLGLAQRSQAKSVVGIDLQPVDRETLADLAEQHDAGSMPPNLEFLESRADEIPMADSSVDVVVSWSVFEHVSDIPSLLQDVHRILVPDGAMFIQIWPLFFSEHGSHMWNWMSDSFAHLRLSDDQFRDEIDSASQAQGLGTSMLDLYESCNRLTLDQLGEYLVDAGFFLAKVELMTDAFHVPPEAQRIPLSQLAVAGVKLIAIRH